MNVFDLCAKISLDKSEYEKGLNDAKKSTGGFLGVFGKVGQAASAVGKGIFDVTERVVKVSAAATAAGAAAVSALTTLAVNSYANYEQLVGGVETLYKSSADTVQKYAAIAYKTAGMSANDYMETATSFAAALVSSLGGDTAAAAELANTAIGDMSDNANKMGTDMESIQNAYNGFSKQNYTMLDNLKLGYGGTKQEMQLLLDDANKLNAAQGKYTKYSIDSYADVVSAIHDVQNAMGVTGTTAKEASITILGSLSAAKAAWANLVTGVADDNANFKQLISNFVDSATTVASNIIPRIEAALDGAAELIESMVPVIMDELPGLIETAIPKLAQSAVNIVQTLVTGISTNAAQLIDSAIQIITVLGNGIYQMLPTVAQSALQIVLTLVSKLNENLPQMLDTAGQMMIAFVEGVSEHLPDIILAAESIVQTLLTYFIEHLPDIVQGAMQIGSAAVKGISDGWTAAWSGFIDMVMGMVNAIINRIKSAFSHIGVKIGGAGRSHAGGLDYVPYNNYSANLHRGEMVLTADEADKYRRGQRANNGFTVNQTIYAAKQTPVELAASTAAYFQQARWAL